VPGSCDIHQVALLNARALEIYPESNDEEELGEPVQGSVIPLVGSPVIPCVCETPASEAHLFTSEDSSVVAEGVTWQYLYLVFCGDISFVQPVEGRAGGDSRVIARRVKYRNATRNATNAKLHSVQWDLPCTSGSIRRVVVMQFLLSRRLRRLTRVALGINCQCHCHCHHCQVRRPGS
jgi:hypothetical protein